MRTVPAFELGVSAIRSAPLGTRSSVRLRMLRRTRGSTDLGAGNPQRRSRRAALRALGRTRARRMQESPDAPGQLCPASPRGARNAGHEHAPAIRVHLTDVRQRDADLAADEEPDIDAQPRLCSEIAGDESAKRA